VAVANASDVAIISGSHDEAVTNETWNRALEQARFADVYQWVLRASDLGVQASELRKARTALDDGRYIDAVRDARRVIERLWRDAEGRSKVGAGPARERDKDDRFLAVADALYGLSSAAAHSDEVTSTFNFNRSDAKAILGCVIALAGRHADL
jgi:hypothetical protein